MGHVNTILHQILSFIPRGQFNWQVLRYDADRYVKTFNAWSHLVAMLFAQATGKNSLRDIVAAFNSQAKKLYHLGALSQTQMQEGHGRCSRKYTSNF